MDSILECSSLKKSYGLVPALKGVDLSLPRGKIIGLLGPNGSGKTTLIKIAAGLLVPSSGTILIDGMAPGAETKAIVSYLPERTYCDMSYRVCDMLFMFRDFYEDFSLVRAQLLLEKLGVPLDAKMKTLSKGTKEKVQLVLVMSRDASIYLLDEPIAGVDPAARDLIISTIISNYKPTATVLISTHLISDIENVLDEFVFIKEGEIVKHDTVANVKNESGKTLDAYFREVFKC